MYIQNKLQLHHRKSNTGLFSFLRIKTKNILSVFIIILSIFSLFFSTIAISSEKSQSSYAFTLEKIVIHGSKRLNNTPFLINLNNVYLGKKTSLTKVTQIKNEIKSFYKEQGIINTELTMQLPNAGEQNLHIFIKEPKQSKKTKTFGSMVTSINFTGNITIEPENILVLADKYVNKPYTFINMMSLQKELKNYYKTTKLTPQISLPDFDVITGDVYINITETSKIEKIPNETPSLIATIEKEQIIKLHKISRGIFMLTSAPKNWKEK